MRIDRWELRDFGSHRHTILEPGDARLVVIVGENGVGKTTLASEALGHALYKDDRGTVGSSVRNGATESVVSIDFAVAGQAYRAIRRRTTRAGGKSSADLQVRQADGSWAPVASGDREVPSAVAELLRMDRDTFRTSVSLAQKDLDRFVAAKAAGRKEILASIVVDPRFAPAAKRAADEARELEAATRGDRDAIARLDDVIAELEPCRAALEARRADAASIESAIAANGSSRNDAEARLRALDAELAEAAAAVPGARDEVARLEELRDQDARDEQTIRTRREAHAVASADAQAARAAWQAEYRAARGRVDELTALLGALAATPCPKCGTPVAPGREDLVARLAGAERTYRSLEGAEPGLPASIAREAAEIARLDARRRELRYDEAALRAAAAELRRLELLAGQRAAVELARASLADAEAAAAAADEELASIGAAGRAAKARLEELTAQQAAIGARRLERDQVAAAIDVLRTERDELEARARATAGAIARLEADVERLERIRAERAAKAAAIAEADTELGRLRKVAAACGLKGIPARVIESVLPELSRHANDVLGRLFGMSIEIRATRATADGKGIVEALDLVIRKEGTGELELERVSGGQETAVSLALAIGLSRLNARRAGTAIRSLVVDEPDGLDVARRRALGQALRQLAHEGELERVVAISHAPELAEFADLVVELREGPDGVELYVDGIRIDPEPAAAAAA